MKRLALLGLLTLAACAPLARIAAPTDDYAKYRLTRTAPTFEQRLAAASTYLDKYPDGVFAGDVKAYLARAEPAFFASKQGSILGLEDYLRALPLGPHASAAKDGLKELRSVKEHGEEGLAAVAEAAHSRAAWQRGRVRDVVTRWIGAFLDKSAFGASLVRAPKDLIVPWALGLPAPVCKMIDPPAGARARRCAKLIELPYSVPVKGVSDERQITLEIAITEDAAGKPLEVTMSSPDLFLRLEEARRVQPLSGDDPEVRIDALEKGVALVRGEVQKRSPITKACEREALAPAVLALACGGVSLTVEAGREGEDRLLLRPSE